MTAQDSGREVLYTNTIAMVRLNRLLTSLRHHIMLKTCSTQSCSDAADVQCVALPMIDIAAGSEICSCLCPGVGPCRFFYYFNKLFRA